jgi:hypothetical protein
MKESVASRHGWRIGRGDKKASGVYPVFAKRFCRVAFERFLEEFYGFFAIGAHQTGAKSARNDVFAYRSSPALGSKHTKAMQRIN